MRHGPNPKSDKTQEAFLCVRKPKSVITSRWPNEKFQCFRKFGEKVTTAARVLTDVLASEANNCFELNTDFVD